VAFRPRKVVSTSLLALIAFSSSASYGLKSEANYPAHFPFAYVQEACGPADGPALLFYFTVKPAKSGKYEEPFVMIEITGDLPKSVPHAYTMGSGSRDMLASRCQSPGQSKNASGEYELHFRGGSIEKATFDATWSFANLICR
jgi:hypothetical protein